ncbi:putative Resolvase, N-terminal domain precursor [Pseudorhizobium banfieldiae]|uniref:Putative Resolvase, N-terminal domain n=1 Tax=Pseudorhizobium banfieldiae TaxID=1125847 RepID=L0NEG4_9HYPH|nr:putative Resolvase, N-terminal domain precursor [Pseudorhizobium banfieldiae]
MRKELPQGLDVDAPFRRRRSETVAERRARQKRPRVNLGPPEPLVERVALYLRVSGERSVESNLSIPDQQAQLEKYCRAKGLQIVQTYIEPGRSAKSTARPAFRTMMLDAQAEVKPFDKILVHNTSRFARSTIDFELCEQILHRAGIQVLAVSQTFARDVGGWVAKKVTTLFDDYHSKRSAVDSVRARRRMVMEGHWPGSTPPYGYKLVPASANSKRRVLALEEAEVTLVEKVFSLVRFGDGESAPMGVKSIAEWLNVRGYRTRYGSRWSVQAVHRMLTNSVYYGVYYWGVSAQEREYQELEEPLPLNAPAIITREEFDAVQETLELRDPKMGAPKLMSSPLLLAGIAKCKCGASMTLGTGTGKSGRVYRYYRCSSDARGQRKCSGPRIREDDLNQVVRDVIRDTVLQEQRLSHLLQSLQHRWTLRRQDADGKIQELRGQIKTAELAFQGLLQAVQTTPSINTQPVFQAELMRVSSELERKRTLLTEALSIDSEFGEITPQRISYFKHEMENVIFGENEAVAKIYIGTIVECVVVGERFITIYGRDEDLRRAILDTTEGDKLSGPGVRRYVRRWRRGWDSNPRYAFDVYSLSRGAPSTTRPPLRCGLIISDAGRLQGLFEPADELPAEGACVRPEAGLNSRRSRLPPGCRGRSARRGCVMRRQIPPRPIRQRRSGHQGRCSAGSAPR